MATPQKLRYLVNKIETFEKRAVGHCEEAKGRRSNPITIR